MTDVDPHDFMDFYRVRVSPHVFTETSMTKDDFDEDNHDFIYSTQVIDDELHIDFTSREGAENVIEEWNYNLDAIRRGALTIRGDLEARPGVNGLLMFHPGKR